MITIWCDCFVEPCRSGTYFFLDKFAYSNTHRLDTEGKAVLPRQGRFRQCIPAALPREAHGSLSLRLNAQFPAIKRIHVSLPKTLVIIFRSGWTNSRNDQIREFRTNHSNSIEPHIHCRTGRSQAMGVQEVKMCWSWGSEGCKQGKRSVAGDRHDG